MSIGISGISPICHAMMIEQLSCSTDQLWKKYESSPRTTDPECKGEYRDRVVHILKKFTKHLKNDLSVGAIVYQEDDKVYAGYVNVDKTEQVELGDKNFYNAFLKGRLFGVLKQDEQLKKLEYFQTSFFSLGEQSICYEIFKLNEPINKVRPAGNIDRDFELVRGEEKFFVNSQALIQNGGAVMSILVNHVLNQNGKALHLAQFSVEVLTDYRAFISVNEARFHSHMKERTVTDITNLHSFAQKCECLALQEECEKLFCQNAINLLDDCLK